MKPNAKKRSANKTGAVLVTAVCVLLVMSILMSATIGYVATNRKKTNSNYSRKQAYLTASNTLKGFVEKVRIMTGKPVSDGSGPEGTAKDVQEQLENIQALQALAAADGGKGTEIDVTYDGEAQQDGYRIGTTKLRISQDNGSANNLVLTATTTYGNETEKVAAHISTTTKKKPARFTNTIEWMGQSGLDLNNMNVVGDTAVLDQGNLNKVYQLTNDVQLKGSLYIWGSIKNKETGGQSLDFHPNILDNSRGSFVQVSGDWYGGLKATSYKQGNDGYNYIYVGGTMHVDSSAGGAGKIEVGKEDYEIDIITHSVKASTNGWSQKGNLYVYKNNTPDATIINNGSFILNSGSVVIDGDVFIEGDLEVKGGSFKCNNLNVAGKVTGSVSVSGKKSVGADATIEKTGRGSEPIMEINSSTYKYMPEDFFMNNDGVSNAEFAKKYADFYNGNNTYDLLNDSDSYTDPTTGAKFNYYVRQSCSFTLDYDIWGKNGGMKNKKNVPWDKDYLILVDVDDSTGDVLIRLKDGVLLGGNGKNCEIVVRNTSTKKPSTLGDGTEVMEHQYNCYFVSDSGDKITFSGKDKLGISQHSNSKSGAFEFNFMNLFDYDTYVRMLKPEYYQNGNRSPQNAGSYVRSDFYFNPTRDESLVYKDPTTGKTFETFCPGSSSIIFLLGENFSLGCKYDPEKGKTNAQAGFVGAGQANKPFIQATVYAPQGAYAPLTQNLTFNVVNSDGSLYNVGKPIQGVGVFIAGAFNNKETSTYVYNEPSGSSVLANAKGDKEGNITGFELDRYDHY